MCLEISGDFQFFQFRGSGREMMSHGSGGYQESARQTKSKKGPKRKVHEFRPFFVNDCVYFLGKQARFTSNFGSRVSLGKVHELAFFWFGLPG